MPERRTVGAVLNKLIERVNGNIRRLRVVEQESSIYKARLSSVESDMLSQRRRAEKELKNLGASIARLEEKIAKIETTTKEIISQLKKVTTTTKIKELEKLIEIYSPIQSQFMTKEEVSHMIDERIKE